MTAVESIVMSAALRARIRHSAELAERSGMPKSTMRERMNHPETIRLGDIATWNDLCRFSDQELADMVRMCYERKRN